MKTSLTKHVSHRKFSDWTQKRKHPTSAKHGLSSLFSTHMSKSSLSSLFLSYSKNPSLRMLGLVAHTCSYLGVGDPEKSQFEAKLGPKLARLHPNKQGGIVVHAWNSSYVRGIGRRILVQGRPRSKVWDRKTTNTKRAVRCWSSGRAPAC
jgi:hypothetical protein